MMRDYCIALVIILVFLIVCAECDRLGVFQ